jgi:hypothetical protein
MCGVSFSFTSPIAVDTLVSCTRNQNKCEKGRAMKRTEKEVGSEDEE